MDIHSLLNTILEDIFMGYPTKIQLIARQKGNQWYVNFPNALAEAMTFKKSETVEWEVESLRVLKMVRKEPEKPKRSQKRKGGS